jgi:hypothetical protein
VYLQNIGNTYKTVKHQAILEQSLSENLDILRISIYISLYLGFIELCDQYVSQNAQFWTVSSIVTNELKGMQRKVFLNY